MRNDYTPWTEEEISLLCSSYSWMRVNAIQQLMPHRTENSIRQKASSLMLKARLDTNIENSIIKEMKDSGANTLTIAKRIGCSLRTVYRRINLIYA